MKILSIFGTRPETIKLAPIVRALQQHPQLESIVCVTAQHRQMLDQMLNLFEIQSDYDLNIMKPNQDLFDVTCDVLQGIKQILMKVKPDYILVQGDTTTAMASSIAAFYLKVPVAHVEAGLRTRNLYAPFPEEFNRSLIGKLAALHFAPTDLARDHLLQEMVDPSRIHVTGNTVIDALFWMRDKFSEKEAWIAELDQWEFLIESNNPIILVTGHRRENFGAGFSEICEAFAEIARHHPDWNIIYPVHLNPNVRLPVQKYLSHYKNIYLIEPLNYAAFVYLMNKARLIITDSGGVQEEAPSLGKPVLVTREVTERQEAVNAGTVILVGTDREKIISEIESLMYDQERYAKMAQIRNPYGDGQAAQRIVGILSSDGKV